MSNQIEKYHMTCEDSLVRFTAKINELLSEGWELYGPAILMQRTEIDSSFNQAMILRTKEPK